MSVRETKMVVVRVSTKGEDGGGEGINEGGRWWW